MLRTRAPRSCEHGGVFGLTRAMSKYRRSAIIRTIAFSCLFLFGIVSVSSAAAQSVPAASPPARPSLPDLPQWLGAIQSIGSSPNAIVAPGENAGQGTGTAHLSAATIYDRPNEPGPVELFVRGVGFASDMSITVSGPGLSSVKGFLHTLNTSSGYTDLVFPVKLELGATYIVHLTSGSDASKDYGAVNLDLEYLIRFQAAQQMNMVTSSSKSIHSTPGGVGFSKAETAKARRLTKQLQREAKANRQLAAAKQMALRSQQELYLQEHPEVPHAPENPENLVSTSSDEEATNLYCQADNAAEKTYVRVRRSVVDPKEASDSYGRRLGRRFLVFEVTVENNNPSLQYLLHDVSVDLSKMHHLPLGTYRWAFSTQDLIMLRGVPEKGSDYDPRNLTYHVARGTGAVAGGVSGIVATGIQDIFAGSVAAFNGPLLTAFIDIFPDHTATQLNRLSDSVFTANMVVAKQSAKTFAVFIPEDLFMTRDEQNLYWKEPIAVFNNPSLDFRSADICVDGAFISEVAAISLASVTYDDPDSLKPGASAKLTVKGANMATGDTLVDVFGGSYPLSSVDGEPGTSAPATAGSGNQSAPVIAPAAQNGIANSGNTTQSGHSLATEAKPNTTTGTGNAAQQPSTSVMATGAAGTTGHLTVTLPPDWDFKINYGVSLESKRTGQKTAPVLLSSTQTPSLTSVAVTTSGAQAQQLALTLKGLRFVSGDTMFLLSGGEYPVTATDATSGTVNVPKPQNYTAQSSYVVQVKSKSTGQVSASTAMPTTTNGSSPPSVQTAEPKSGAAMVPTTDQVSLEKQTTSRPTLLGHAHAQ